jgi:DNA adenine methylase
MNLYLKWPGSKWDLAPKIGELLGLPKLTRYCTPFLGGGGELFGLARAGLLPDSVVAGDKNASVMAVHRLVQSNPGDISAELELLPQEPGWAKHYGQIRQDFNDSEGQTPARVARMIWLSRACFNGIWRENRAGKMNQSVGRYKRVELPSPELLRARSKDLSGVELVTGDFEKVLYAAGLTAGDGAYLDAPYTPLSSTANFTQYGGAWSPEHAWQLSMHVRRLVRRGCRVLVSEHACEAVSALYPRERFQHAEIEVHRRASCKASTRGAVTEVFISRREP